MFVSGPSMQTCHKCSSLVLWSIIQLKLICQETSPIRQVIAAYNPLGLASLMISLIPVKTNGILETGVYLNICSKQECCTVQNGTDLSGVSAYCVGRFMSIHLHAVECNRASVATLPICTSIGISNAPDTYNSHCTEDLTCVLEDYGRSHTLVVVIKHKKLFCSLICFNSRMGHGCFFRDLCTSPTADLSHWKDRCYIYEGSWLKCWDDNQQRGEEK
jgi:hypothetical protein